MTQDILQHIQSLQFTDKTSAEQLLRTFIGETFPLDVAQVELRPLAVSLNSFNGFLTLADGQRLFFKTHTEPDNVIGEYYRAELLAEAGYPVIQPLFASNEAGRQLLIYEVIDDPSVFDVAWEIETGTDDLLTALTTAQNSGDDALLEIYLKTLQHQSAEDASQAPVHQLFFHRLTGGRLTRFYGTNGDEIQAELPGRSTTMAEVRRAKWVVNGQYYQQTLDDLIDRAVRLLHPAQSGPAVIGHGDAHNGNVFFRRQEQTLLYFDPAFAGSHHPLLDLTKPLFHNVFAMWMYFPQVKHEQTSITLRSEGSVWHVEHDYGLHPVREMFLYSKVARVLVPVLLELQERGWLRPDWRDYLKAALFCCPFLTLNLADHERFSPEIRLLGLSMAVEMGAESHTQRSLIDRVLDDVANQLMRSS